MPKTPKKAPDGFEEASQAPLEGTPLSGSVSDWVRQLEQVAEDMEERAEHMANVTYTSPTITGEVETTLDESTAVAAVPRVGRNDPCPCGSGKKYKNCHGKLS